MNDNSMSHPAYTLFNVYENCGCLNLNNLPKQIFVNKYWWSPELFRYGLQYLDYTEKRLAKWIEETSGQIDELDMKVVIGWYFYICFEAQILMNQTKCHIIHTLVNQLSYLFKI